MAKMLGVEERTDLRRASLISEIYSETHTSGFPGRARPKRPGLGGKFGKLGKLKKVLGLIACLMCHFILSGSQFRKSIGNKAKHRLNLFEAYLSSGKFELRYV